jgi:ParB family chromosome partitioning protein
LDISGYLDFTSLVEPVPTRAILPPSVPVRSEVGDLGELIVSIRSIGLIHPILLRPIKGDKFEVVAGVRRFEACKVLRWTQIPAVIREMQEREAYEIALVENIQRKSMNPIEEARALKTYAEKEGWGGITRLAERLGKSKSYISQRILLLSLPMNVQEKLAFGEIDPSIARQLFCIDDSKIQEEIASNVTELRLSTRSTAHLIKSFKLANCREKSGNVNQTDGISYPDFASSKEVVKISRTSIRALQQTILAMRLVLARLDIIMQKCEKEEPEVAEYIHGLRFEIHTMLEDCIRKKMEITFSRNTERNRPIMKLES